MKFLERHSSDDVTGSCLRLVFFQRTNFRFIAKLNQSKSKFQLHLLAKFVERANLKIKSDLNLFNK